MDFPASHGEAGHPMGLPCRLFDAPVSTMDFGISLGGRISWNLWPVEDRHGEISEHVMPVRYVRYCFLLQKANKSTRTLVTALRTWIWYDWYDYFSFTAIFSRPLHSVNPECYVCATKFDMGTSGTSQIGHVLKSPTSCHWHFFQWVKKAAAIRAALKELIIAFKRLVNRIFINELWQSQFNQATWHLNTPINQRNFGIFGTCQSARTHTGTIAERW